MSNFAPLLCFLVAIVCVNVALGTEVRPSIAIILADDFGVGEIQAHYSDNKIATLHLDRLVRQGMSFSDAHGHDRQGHDTYAGSLVTWAVKT